MEFLEFKFGIWNLKKATVIYTYLSRDIGMRAIKSFEEREE
jgi:hypothetical protein